MAVSRASTVYCKYPQHGSIPVLYLLSTYGAVGKLYCVVNSLSICQLGTYISVRNNGTNVFICGQIRAYLNTGGPHLT